MKTSSRTGKAVGSRIGSVLAGTALLVIVLSASSNAAAAGLLKPSHGGGSPIHIKSHDVNVVINNGFSKTEVDQVFLNESDRDMEAIYTLPLPKQASLSELSLWIDGKETIGEVLEKEKAKAVYEKQKARGKETAIAEKDDFRTIDIGVGVVRARSETRVRFVYYQPVEIDLNVGRYLYPLSEGNVDDERIKFWAVDSAVREKFTFNMVLKSAFPVKDLRLPDYQDKASIEKLPGEGTSAGEVFRVRVDKSEGADISRDIVVYYRLDDSVPARVELIPYRKQGETGTVMVVVTPAASLRKITEGVDWTFVLDASGSMGGRKIQTLIDGVGRVLGKMSPGDRFRIVTFNSRASDFTGGYVEATEKNVRETVVRLKQIQASGGTALFEGLDMACGMLEPERTTGIILVTDGVANIGPTRHEDFLKLVGRVDVRLFTFVIGNSANQPLMDRIAKESGGFAMNVSEGDDIAGRLIQAKAKVFHERLHDVSLTFHGEKVKDLTPAKPGSLYMGQQLVMFGRYSGHGEVELELKARISGQEQTWRCGTELPAVDTDNPELERLWALSAIEDRMEEIRENGETGKTREEIVELGREYSIVTDYTSMVVLREEEMEGERIERRNAQRVEQERRAQQTRGAAAVKSYRVDGAAGGSGVFGDARAPGIGSIGEQTGTGSARERRTVQQDRDALPEKNSTADEPAGKRDASGVRPSGTGSGPVGPLFVALAWWLNRGKRDR